VLALIVILLLPLIILAEVILRLTRQVYRPFPILIALYNIVVSLRGLQVDVRDKKKDSMVFVRIT
jgi:hypothetical protein